MAHQHVFTWPAWAGRQTVVESGRCACGAWYSMGPSSAAPVAAPVTTQRTNYCPLCESNTRRADAAEVHVAVLLAAVRDAGNELTAHGYDHPLPELAALVKRLDAARDAVTRKGQG